MIQNQHYPFYIAVCSSGSALSLKTASDCRKQLGDAGKETEVYREYFTIADNKIDFPEEWTPLQQSLSPELYQKLRQEVLNWLEAHVLYGQELDVWNSPEHCLVIDCHINALQGDFDLDLHDSTVGEIREGNGQVVLHSGNHIKMAKDSFIAMEESDNTIDTLCGTAYLSVECDAPVCIGSISGNARIIKKNLEYGGGIRLEAREDGSCYIFYIRYPRSVEEEKKTLGITCSSYPPKDYEFTGWDEFYWHVDSDKCSDEEMQKYLKEIAEEIKVIA